MYLDWMSLDRDVYTIDIETDSLDPAVIWCLCWRNVRNDKTGEARTLAAIRAFFDETEGALYVGHNALKFDGPVLVRLAGLSRGRLDVRNTIDTLVLSTLYSPSISGGHSLGAWGERLGNKKGGFHDFSHISDEMVEYCHQDVAITTELFKRLIKTLARLEFSEKSIWIQHRFTVLLEQQRRNGFYFDGKRALGLFQELRTLESSLQETIREKFPSPLEEVARYKRAYKQDGECSIRFTQHMLEFEKVEVHDDGSYSAYNRVEFNIGSPKQRVEKLLDLGWEPEEFTKTGQPKPFEKGDLSPSLQRLLEENPVPEVQLIAKWMAINGRTNMIGNWLDNYNEETLCIHGKLFVADTLRLRHQAPNTANIPAVRSHKDGTIIYGDEGCYTYESRDLWTARPGRVLVGTDAAGLELRMLAHFLARPEFTEQVVNGDPHQYNADLVGISRPQAKTLIYAILYGAAAPKIGKTLGVSVKEAGHIRNLFLEKLGVGRLIEECKREQRDGRVLLVDGSRVICPSPHAALNYKLQGSGARVMALGAVLLDRGVRRLGLDCLKVGDIHDEWQFDVDNGDADRHGALAVDCIRESGERLNLKVPLGGTSKKGLTWAETH